MTTYIGDVHGGFRTYYQYIKLVGPDVRTCVVGDFGLFGGQWEKLEIYWQTLINTRDPHKNHRRIRGNHDNPHVFFDDPRSIKDGTWEKTDRGFIMYVGGAKSNDIEHRKEGKTWWPEEELSQVSLDEITKIYSSIKPFRMVTHDCPESVARQVFSSYRDDAPTRTRQAFDAMLSVHSPEEWVFGHWHEHVDRTINGTRFICLPPMETIQLKD